MFGRVVLTGVAAAGAAFFAYAKTQPMPPGETLVRATLNEHAAVYAHAGTETHVTWVASNDPVEDRHAVAALGDRLVLGVYDGHAGWQCSDLLARCLHNYIGRHWTAHPGTRALHAAYTEMDADLMAMPAAVQRLTVPVPTAQEMLMPAMAGSVLVNAVVEGDRVYVAHAGDCRAVVGRRDAAAQRWVAMDLTEDHDADNPREVERMKAEHQGEEDVVLLRKRVLGGLQPTRSMGDARYKWPHDVQEWIGRIFESSSYRYKAMPRFFKTPPYVTAEPEVAEYRITDADHFMVLATDGLWERMTSTQVVDCVGEYVQQIEKGLWAHTDDNAAAHVVRNAFGGRETDAVASLLRIPAPLSRNYRDDITVLVVFFKPRTVGPTFSAPKQPTKVDLAKSKIVPTPGGIELQQGATPELKAKL